MIITDYAKRQASYKQFGINCPDTFNSALNIQQSSHLPQADISQISAADLFHNAEGIISHPSKTDISFPIQTLV
ncbi:MAG: hypothetical protein IKZ98_06805 [Clostridia bacterium]|nr:hypothetical protein [Clostridia bacterium]